MSYLSKLRASRDKPQVAYTEFTLSTKKGQDCLFCFFEGKDNAYYIPRIKNFTTNYHPIQCGGKDKVLATYQLIKHHPEYDKYKKAFFVDRDFDEPLTSHNPPIFETPYYSIENFYVSEYVFRQILINEFYLSEVSDSAFTICIQLFQARQEEFHQSVIMFNAWYACLIKIRSETGKPTGVNLTAKFPESLLDKFSLDSISANYDFGDLQTLFPQAPLVEEEQFKKKLEDFASYEYHQVFRGKYELEFVLKFIELLIKDSVTSQQHLKSKLKFSFGSKLNNEQAIKVFSNYAETPDSLISYLRQVA